MKLDERNFIFNLQQLNKEEPYARSLFKRPSFIKKFFSTWLILIVIVGMTYLCGKIALEGLFPFITRMLHG